MDRKLRKILTDCIGDIETGARDVEGCLKRYPDRAAELRPHLELWSGLNASAKAQPNFGSQQRGKQQLLGALSDMDKAGGRRVIPTLSAPAAVKAVAALAAAALLVGGAAGASAAFGGPDFADDVLSTVGINKGSHDGDHAADAAQDGLETAHDSSDNSGGEPAAAGDGQSTADAGADNSVDGPAAAQDGLDNAPQASDSVQEDARVPDSVTVGPTP